MVYLSATTVVAGKEEMPTVVEESRFAGQDEWVHENTWDVVDYADSLKVLTQELFAQADVKMATAVTAVWMEHTDGGAMTVEYEDGELTWRYRWVEDEPETVKAKPTAPRMTVQVDWYHDEGDELLIDPYLIDKTSVTVTVVATNDPSSVIQVTGPMDELVNWVHNVHSTGDWETTLDTVKQFIPVP